MTGLETRGLTVALGDAVVLTQVSLSVGAGEFVGLLGPNGAGKSTVIRAAAGLVPVTSGSISLCGHSVSTLSARRRAQLLALVPQSTDLDFSFSVADIVVMGRQPHLGRFAFETTRDDEIARQALRDVGMEAFAEREMGTLSGGERQRVFIAKAIAQQPRVLLLDEPISALDIRHQLEVLRLARPLRSQGRAVLAALHDLDLAARHCDRLVVLHDGHVIADGEPSEVLTRELMAEVYRVHASVSRDPVTGRPTVIAHDLA